jgi:hypothetical protein
MRHLSNPVLMDLLTAQYASLKQAFFQTITGDHSTRVIDQLFPLQWYLWITGVFHLNLIGLETGSGLFQEASFFNHDCDPNVLIRPPKIWNQSSRPPLGPSIVFEAARDIDIDEELCISYIHDVELGYLSSAESERGASRSFTFGATRLTFDPEARSAQALLWRLYGFSCSCGGLCSSKERSSNSLII